MPIVPNQATQQPPISAVSLAAYARAIGVCECGFWGVNDPDCVQQDCLKVWTKSDRDFTQYYLAEAQQEIERVLNHHVGRRWVTDERHFYQRLKAQPIITTWGYVISGGVQAESTILAGAAVICVGTTCTVGPIGTTVTDARELKLFFINTDIEIDPSAIMIAAGNVTFAIPKCRLVAPAFYDNPAAGYQLADAVFAATVDVKRVYNSTSTEAMLVREDDCTNCTETLTGVCIYVRKPNIGSVALGRASVCGCVNWVELNYYSGREMIDVDGYHTRGGRQAQDAIIRLAHVKMPHTPCGCDPVRDIWQRDRQVIVDGRGGALRGVSPFGPEEGAWTAWRFTNSMKLVKGATL